MNEEDWVELLREAHREPIDPAHCAAVRARVLAEIGRARKPVWRWAWALSAAAVVVAVMLVPRSKPVGRASWPAFLVYGPARPMEQVAEVPKPVAHHRRPIRRQEGRPGGPPHLEPVVIKLLTDDPNVVIYWIGE